MEEYKALFAQKKPLNALVANKLKETEDRLREMQIEKEEKIKSLSVKLEAMEFERESSEFMKWMLEKRNVAWVFE